MNYILAIIIILGVFPVCGYSLTTKSYDTESDFKINDTNYHYQTQVRGSSNTAAIELMFQYQPLSGNKPSKRRWSPIAYDNTYNKAVLFGGYGDYPVNNTPLVDTWEFNPENNTWLIISVSNAPTARYGHGLAPLGNGQVMLFGGTNGSVYFNETYKYNITPVDNWQLINVSSAPSKRAYFSMCASPTKVVLFGGTNDSGAFLNDTWIYDIGQSIWSTSSAVSPTARSYAAMAYNSDDGMFYLFGGYDNSGPTLKQDLWKYDVAADSWGYVSCGTSPFPRQDAVMFYDQKNQRLTLYGGEGASSVYDEKIWCYNSGNWYSGVPLSSPTVRSSHAAAYIFPLDKALIFGGFYTVKLDDAYYYLYRSSGIFTSPVIDAGSGQTALQWKNFSVNSTIPSYTTLKFQIATSLDNVWEQERYYGPGGLETSYYELSSNDIWVGNNDRRYLKYRAYLNSTQPPYTPSIDKITITYNFAPAKPVLYNPINSGSTNYLTPLFTWNNASDPDNTTVPYNDTLTYEIQIDTTVNFSPSIIYSSAIVSGQDYSSYSSTTSLYHGTWYWRVRANDGYTDSEWSNNYTLYVDTAAPDRITDLAAQIGDANRQVYLSWTMPDDANPNPVKINYGYEIRYSSYTVITDTAAWNEFVLSSSTGIIANAMPGTLVTASVSNLRDATTYYLAVRINDPAGTQSSISTPTASAFTNAPPVVILSTPIGSKTWTGTQLIAWSSSDPNNNDSRTFDIFLSSNSGASYSVLIATALPYGTSTYFWETREVSNGLKYRVEVVARDLRGLTGAAESSDIIILNPNEAPSVTINSPKVNETISGTIPFSWSIWDPNRTDTHTSQILISSDSGQTYSWRYFSSTSTLSFNTRPFKNGLLYSVKIITSDSGTPQLSGEAVRAFIINNNNMAPNSFSLISPSNGTFHSPLDLEFVWENNGDPNSEDSITFTFYLSTSSTFSGGVVAEGLTNSYYKVPLSLMLPEHNYYWKIIAKDPFDLKRECNEISWLFILSRFKTETYDGRVYAEILEGLPDNGYIKIEKIDTSSNNVIKAASINKIIQTADQETISDRLVKSLQDSIYKISVCDANNTDIAVPSIKLSVAMKYIDTDSDGYFDGTKVRAENLRCALLNEDSQRWELVSALPSLNKNNKKVSSIINRTGVITIMGALTPLAGISNVVNYPNPFYAGREETRIKYVLTENKTVTINIYTLLGDLVWTKKYDEGTEGGKGQASGYTNEITWNGYNNSGQLAANGMYLMEIKSGSERQIRKIGIVKQ